MKTIKIIIIYVSFGLSFFSAYGQQIGNYVNNGGFEFRDTCLPLVKSVRYWNSLDSTNNLFGGVYTNTCHTSGCCMIPLNSYSYQFPKSGSAYILGQFYCPSCGAERGYLKNRLKSKLDSGKTYCSKMYVNSAHACLYRINSLGMYYGGVELDTITVTNQAVPWIVPQIETPNIIDDTLNWIPVSGTFVATGQEKYLVIGCFKTNAAVNYTSVNNGWPGWAGYNIDEVTCIEFNLPAYAGTNVTITPGDSVFLGRQSDWAIDPSCIWYKLPNMATAIDTTSGIWVKPSSTSTYVVRQELDCSPLKWDTVVVTVSTNYVGLDKLQNLSDNIYLFPNPTSDNLSISGFSGSDISTFSISNCLAQIIQTGNIIQKNNLINVETSELKSGLYLIHLKTQHGIVTKKFVKTN